MAPTQLIWVATGLGLPIERAVTYTKQAAAACPSDYEPFTRLRFFLSARWHGSAEIMLNWVHDVVAMRPEEPAMRMLVVEAYHDIAELMRSAPLRQAYLQNPTVAREIQECLNAVAAKYPGAREEVASW